MSKPMLWLISFFSMVVVSVIATVVMINDGGIWTAVPILIWFVLGQIFIVPKILRKKDD